jgi:tight adherence protein B
VRVLAGLCVALIAAVVVSMVAGHRSLRTRGGRTLGRKSASGSRVARATWLQQAGVGLTPTQFWASAAASGAVTLAVVTALTRAPLVAIAPAMAAASVPHLVCSRRRAVRLRAWQAAWPDALREVIAAVVSGRSLPHAVTALGEFGPDPLRDVFSDFRVLTRVFGFAGALEQVKERLADPTSDRVVEVLIVAHQQGGAIVRDVLEDLVVATTKDLKVLDEIDTEGLEMRINARAVLVLPWAVLVALTLRPGPFRAFYQSTAGVLVLLGAGALSVLGATWLGRLGRQPAEPRVFAPVATVAPRSMEEQAA